MNNQGNKNKDILTRRDFFRLAAKKVLPILGGIAFGPVLLSSCGKDEEVAGKCTDCSGTCYKSCSGKNNSSSGNNQSGCSSSCYNSCKDKCTTSCYSSCLGGCKNSCNDSCDSSCLGYCEGSCDNNCGSKCSGTCIGTCNKSCYGSSERKIRVRLLDYDAD